MAEKLDSFFLGLRGSYRLTCSDAYAYLLVATKDLRGNLPVLVYWECMLTDGKSCSCLQYPAEKNTTHWPKRHECLSCRES